MKNGIYSVNSDFKLSLVFLSVFVGIVIFFITYGLVLLLSALIVYLVVQVGILRFLLGILTEGHIDYALFVISAMCAYTLSMFLLEKINKKYSLSLKYSLLGLGILIVVLHLVFLIINIIIGGLILSNIAQIIVGIVLIYKATQIKKPSTSTEPHLSIKDTYGDKSKHQENEQIN